MMDRDRKVLTGLGEDDRPSAEQMVMLDEQLGSLQGQSARKWVGALPEDQPSLAWRSALNERLREQQPRPRFHSWFLYPGLGLATAGALALVIWMAQPAPVGTPPSGPTLEAALVSTHLESVRASEIAGAGMAPHDIATLHTASADRAEFEWNVMEAETL